MRNAKFFLFAAALTLGSMQAFAVKGIEDGSKYGTGEDSIRCLEQLSLYQSYYTIKDYNSAYSSWKVVFDECPKAGNRTFYSRGAFLIANQMSKDAADPAKYKEWFDLLMKCYEARVQYCGNDTRYPEPYIRGRQAIDFIKYSTDEDKHAKALPWLKMAVDKMADIALTGAPRRIPEGFDPAGYGRRHFGMFTGRPAQVTLVCRDELAGVVLDRFGQDAMLVPREDGHFSVSVDVAVSPQFWGWIFALGEGVRVAAPQWAVAEYRRCLQQALEACGKEENL